MLELKDIRWSLPESGKEILKGVSLRAEDGKCTVITGPNGGGKTTLAKIIAGIKKQDGGQVLLDGRPLDGMDVTQRAQAGVGYAFQQPVRFKGLTVRDLMELAAGGALAEDAMCAWLSQVGLCARDYVDREIDASLSGGEIKRIEIATVLARKPRLAVFDEPEAGIDLWSFDSLVQVFQGLARKGEGSILIISHQRRILEIADEILVVSGGVVAHRGTKEEIFPLLFPGETKPAGCACPLERGAQA